MYADFKKNKYLNDSFKHDEMNKQSQDLLEKMSKRRTVRRFSDKPVDNQILINSIKIAGTAPSGANTQPWLFALVTDSSMKKRIRDLAEEVERDFYHNKASKEWLEDLKQFKTNADKSYLTEAPALIVIFSQRSCKLANGEQIRTYYPMESTGIATGFLIASLHLAGLATLTHTPQPMNFLNEVLDIDKSYKPFMIIVTGYAQEPLVLPNLTKKTLDQIFRQY